MLTKNSSSTGKSVAHELQSIDHIASQDTESAIRSLDRAATNPSDHVVEIPHRNPWLMRTHLNFPIIPFPFSRKAKEQDHVSSPSQVSLNHISTPPGQTSPPIRTRVWHDEHRDGRNAERRDDDDADGRSVASAQGVVVETQLVHESHPSNVQR